MLVLLPDKTILPAPNLLIPNEPLITPLIVKSSADTVPSSATVMVLLAPKATGQDIIAPSVPVAAAFTVMFPPNVSLPVPVIEAPIKAPPSRVMLIGVPKVKVDKLKTELSFTVSAPPTVALAVIDFVPFPSIERLLKVVVEFTFMVWFPVPLNLTVLVLGVKVPNPVVNVKCPPIFIVPAPLKVIAA